MKITNNIIYIVFCLFFLMNLDVFADAKDLKKINYVIDVTINPLESSLTGASKITVNSTDKEISFKLLKSLKIIDFKSTDFDYKLSDLDSNYTTIIIQRKSGSNQKNPKFSISYSGKVYDLPAETNLTQRHSHSMGIISPKNNEGIYLPGGSFYPVTENSLGSFECVIKGPSDYIFITSGNIEVITKKDNSIIRKWVMPFDTDELTIVGGKFVQYTKEYDGKYFFLFTYDSTNLSDKYLDAVIDQYKVYIELLGNYPFKQFSIVENFFATGFGMPGYTLLSGKLLAMPWVTLSPGSLAHEFVHNWWGNSVYVDYNGGNWCEALTSFCSNYYFNVAKSNPEGAVDWRKKALMSIDALEPEKNYPVIKFKYQENMFDAVVGYQKGGFLFYEILKLIGKDAFFTALKNLSADFRGKRAYWSDLIDEFTKASQYSIVKKYDLSDIINKWLNSKEIPKIQLLDVKRNDRSIQITLSKTTDLTISVPVKFVGKDKEETEYYVISENKSTLNYTPDFEVQKVIVDPNYEALRQIYSWEKPFSFNRTLSAEPIVVLPPDSSHNYKIALEFYKEMVASDYKFKSVSADKITAQEISNNSLILLGSPADYKLMNQVTVHFPDKIKYFDSEYHFSGKTSKLGESIFLINTDHISNDSKCLTAIFFDNLNDISPLKRLFHYQSYSSVLLVINKPGRPLFDSEIFPKTADKKELEKIIP